MDGQLYAGINGMNQHPHKRAIQIAFMPFTIAKLFPKISTKLSVPWAVDEWGHYLGESMENGAR